MLSSRVFNVRGGRCLEDQIFNYFFFKIMFQFQVQIFYGITRSCGHKYLTSEIKGKYPDYVLSNKVFF